MAVVYDGSVINVRLAAIPVKDQLAVQHRPALKIICCGEARVCSLCGTVICFEHDDSTPVICEVLDIVCADCHQACTNIPCAREHADPDLWR